ncbi:MAG: alpha/beta hydrolase family protein [Bacteroidaceae bacterium]
MKTRICVLGLLLLCVSAVQAVKVDTLLVKSEAMNENVKVVMVVPEQAKKQACPVVYLLNGFSDNGQSWVKRTKPELPKIADKEGIIFVCPYGNDSWYFDSPVNPKMRYETFVSKELVAYVDAHYKTRAEKGGRAIMGLSMGGHGAMWLSFRHTDIFGAAGSMSGGLDILPFPNNWNLKKVLGEKSTNEENWATHTAISQIDKIKNGDLAIIFDCGYQDFFFEVNNNFHNKLMERKIDHDFVVRPGGHSHQYWSNSMDYQLLFFKKFFNKK